MEQITDIYNLEGKSPLELPMSRNGLPELFYNLGLRTGAEIGVEKGRFAKRLCQGGLRVYGIDAWAAYPGYREHLSQDKVDGLYEEAKERLKDFDCKLIKGFSVDVSFDFDDESLDFVYIDGAHDFLNVTQDIYYWEKKVRKGGIVSGHDFRRGDSKWTCHVKDVVGAWTYAHGIKTWFKTNEKSASWLWQKI